MATIPQRRKILRWVLLAIVLLPIGLVVTMRLRRGTRVKICGVKGCVTRTVRDWGPASYLGHRIADLTPGDFMRVSGKSLSGAVVMRHE